MKNPRVVKVVSDNNFIVNLTFTNGEVGFFDVKPYLEMGIFKELKDENYFRTVKSILGTIQWPNGQDFCPDTLYLESKKISSKISPI